MSKKTTYLLGIILTILVGTYFFIACCSSCRIILQEEVMSDDIIIANEELAETSSSPFLLVGDHSCSYNVNDNFNTSFFYLLRPLSQKIGEALRLNNTTVPIFN